MRCDCNLKNNLDRHRVLEYLWRRRKSRESLINGMRRDEAQGPPNLLLLLRESTLLHERTKGSTLLYTANRRTNVVSKIIVRGLLRTGLRDRKNLLG
jgi:hypothetical protein